MQPPASMVLVPRALQPKHRLYRPLAFQSRRTLNLISRFKDQNNLKANHRKAMSNRYQHGSPSAMIKLLHQAMRQLRQKLLPLRLEHIRLVRLPQHRRLHEPWSSTPQYHRATGCMESDRWRHYPLGAHRGRKFTMPRQLLQCLRPQERLEMLCQILRLPFRRTRLKPHDLTLLLLLAQRLREGLFRKHKCHLVLPLPPHAQMSAHSSNSLRSPAVRRLPRRLLLGRVTGHSVSHQKLHLRQFLPPPKQPDCQWLLELTKGHLLQSVLQRGLLEWASLLSRHRALEDCNGINGENRYHQFTPKSWAPQCLPSETLMVTRNRSARDLTTAGLGS